MDTIQHHAELLKRSIARCQERMHHDPELVEHAPVADAAARIAACSSSIRCVVEARDLYATRTCFVERTPELHGVTYAELWSRVEALVGGLRHGNIASTGSMVGICGFASIDWVVADLACLHMAATSVPLPTSTTPADLGEILRGAEIRVAVCSVAQLDLLLAALPSCPLIEAVVLMDRGAADVVSLAEKRTTLPVYTMSEIEVRGRAHAPLPFVEPEPGALMTLVYTSGSTGTPKGAMFPERLWRAMWSTAWSPELPLVPHLTVGYMPLNHMLGRLGIIRSLVEGGKTTFVRKSDMSTLFEDIQTARPTVLALVPRAASMIYQRFQTEVVKRARGGDAARVEQEVMAEMRDSFLGERLVFMTAGSAPTPPEIMSFLERCFDVPVFDGYGATEAGPIALDGHVARDVTAVKIIDVPELGYRTTDEPHPRGELCIRSTRLIPGYYRNPEATRQLFDDEGYLVTGDIVEQLEDGRLVWIDRRKNVLKLAQGEFVSVSRLEELYRARSPFIDQIYLYGSSLRSYLLAVVVPDMNAVLARLPQANDASVKQLLRAELDRVAAEAGVMGYEIPREILVEREPFTVENGLLTESKKPSRPRLRARYGVRLEELYVDIERRQLSELTSLAAQSGAPPDELVRKAMEATLGVRDLDEDQSFLQLGGDSLTAVRLADLVEDLSGVEVPVGRILDRTSSVRALGRYVEERLSGAPSRPGFEDVHGAGAEIVRAQDLHLEAVMPREEIAAPRDRAADEPRVVLLTGANGFLGRFLLLSALERVGERGQVVCVVRAKSDAAARERIAAAYRGPDPSLLARFAQLSAGDRLRAVAGDLGLPRFGLTEDRYERLASEVDAIVHNGALVNHALSYRELFEPNVLGTAEVMRLSLHRRIKPIGFISTVGVASGLQRTTPVREDEDARSLWPARPIDGGYAVGYGTSKWADEILLRDLATRCGVPVSVFRCSMIMPPERYAGQINAGDFLTRLWLGVIMTGLAPRSFYAGGPEGHHFDGLPVDFVADSIAAVSLGSHAQGAYEIFHVVNAHRDDQVTLDSMVDWIEAAGHPVTRIDDHARWLRAFRDKLEALSPAERQRSPLPILRQWERPIAGPELVFDNAHLRARLGVAEVPRLTRGYVLKCLRDLQEIGLIRAPRAAA